MQIRELDLKELYEVYEVVSQLYDQLTYKEFEDLIYEMRHTEYKMMGILENNILVTYAGVVITTNFYYKRHLHILELVTDTRYRKKGYASSMIEYLKDYAKMGMCENIVVTINENQKSQILSYHGFLQKDTTLNRCYSI